MTTSGTSPIPDTMVITLPEGWVQAPTDPAELVALIRAGLVARLDPAVTGSMAFKRELVLIRRLAEQADRGGVVFLAGSVEDLGAEDVEEPYLLTSVCYVATRSAAELGAGRIQLAQLQQAVEAPRPDPSVSRAEQPRLVELGGGPAIRDVALRRVPVPGGGGVEVLEVRYHQLIGEGVGMAVLGLVSPNVELAGELVGLYDTIAGSLEFVAA